jgi:hypothetical protein
MAIAISVAVSGAIVTQPAEAATTSVTVYPTPSAELLTNPGKGWIGYSSDSATGSDFSQLTPAVWDVISVAYSRFTWAALNPADGIYNWTLIDDLIDEAQSHGKTFAFGVMSANSSSANPDVPGWVYNAGATYTTVNAYDPLTNSTYQKQIPVWDDPIYMAKLSQFITALEARYDGDAAIEFIDIRNFGNWGEWHLYDIPGSQDISDAAKRAHIDMWSGFTDTRLVVPINGETDGYLPADYARYATDQYDVALRRDGLIKLTESQDGVMYAYDRAPAIGEFFAKYQWLVNDGSWSDAQLDRTFTEGRFSYMGLGQWDTDPATMLTAERAAVQKWANKMGYWFRVPSATYEDTLGNGQTSTISFSVRNDGLAPIHTNRNQSYVKLALLDSSNNILRTMTLTGVNPFDWKPGVTVTETEAFSFPSTPGATKLALGVFSRDDATAPDVRLGIEGRLPTGWYPLTDMPLTPNYVANGSFEEGGSGQQGIPGWETWAANTNDIDVDYTESGAVNFSASSGNWKLIHYKNQAAPYEMSTYQDVKLPNGTYRVSVHHRNDGGHHELQVDRWDAGNTRYVVSPTTASTWTEISQVVTVTTGTLRVGLYSNANSASYIAWDDVRIAPF